MKYPLSRPVHCIGIVAKKTGLGLLCTLWGFAASAQAPQGGVSAENLATAVSALDTLVGDAMAETGVPGVAVAVVHDGETIFAKGYGVREIGKPDPVDAGTVFQIASLSKSLSATVVARQVGKKVVDWTTPVKAVLPDFELSDPWVGAHVTIGDLFAHRSGLPPHVGDDLEDIGFDRSEIISRLVHIPLAPFRASYAYTNFGLTAAAEAVAVASGTDWASLAESALYGPLGMDHTSSRFADFQAKANRASGHMLVDGVHAPFMVRKPDAQSPAGGVSSTVEDLARWMIMVLDEGTVSGTEIVKSSALLPAVMPQVVSRNSDAMTSLPSFYGFGFNVGLRPSGQVSLSHSGAFGLGTGTAFMMVPDYNLGIVILTNAAPLGVPEAIGAQFMDLAETGEIQRDWLDFIGGYFADFADPSGVLVGASPPELPRAAADLNAYAGIYHNGYVGDVTIEATENGNGLVLHIGPKGSAIPLSHWDKDTFTYSVVTENNLIGSISSVTFSEPVDGKAPTLTLEPFRPGLDVLTRKE